MNRNRNHCAEAVKNHRHNRIANLHASLLHVLKKEHHAEAVVPEMTEDQVVETANLTGMTEMTEDQVVETANLIVGTEMTEDQAEETENLIVGTETKEDQAEETENLIVGTEMKEDQAEETENLIVGTEMTEDRTQVHAPTVKMRVGKADALLHDMKTEKKLAIMRYNQSARVNSAFLNNQKKDANHCSKSIKKGGKKFPPFLLYQ